MWKRGDSCLAFDINNEFDLEQVSCNLCMDRRMFLTNFAEHMRNYHLPDETCAKCGKDFAARNIWAHKRSCRGATEAAVDDSSDKVIKLGSLECVRDVDKTPETEVYKYSTTGQLQHGGKETDTEVNVKKEEDDEHMENTSSPASQASSSASQASISASQTFSPTTQTFRPVTSEILDNAKSSSSISRVSLSG